MSLLLADFTLLLQCYFVVYQSLVGAPVFGATGKNIAIFYKRKLMPYEYDILIYIAQCNVLYISFMKGCYMYGFFATISALAEIWSLTAVSFDRLQAINNPLNAQKRISKSQV